MARRITLDFLQTEAAAGLALAIATVSDLGSGAGDRLRLRLVGTSTKQLHVAAVPTILQ